MSRRASKHAGFTLAELLIATMLLSIVMTAVYTLFHSAIGSWRAVEGEFNAAQDARNALSLFERELDNVLAQAGYLMEGKNDDITMFIVTEPLDVDKTEGSHLMRVRYYFNKSQKELIREEAMVEMSLPKNPPQGRELDRQRIKVGRDVKFVVANNVDDFEVRYVWVPLVKREDPKTPPSRVDPIVVDVHHLGWGLPQALDLKLTFEDPNDKSKRTTISTRLPVVAPSAHRMDKDLQKMLKDVQ